VAQFGKIDVLAHLVGGFAGGQTVAETDDSTLQRMFDMNLASAFHTLRAVIPHVRAAARLPAADGSPPPGAGRRRIPGRA